MVAVVTTVGSCGPGSSRNVARWLMAMTGLLFTIILDQRIDVAVAAVSVRQRVAILLLHGEPRLKKGEVVYAGVRLPARQQSVDCDQQRDANDEGHLGRCSSWAHATPGA